MCSVRGGENSAGKIRGKSVARLNGGFVCAASSSKGVDAVGREQGAGSRSKTAETCVLLCIALIHPRHSHLNPIERTDQITIFPRNRPLADLRAIQHLSHGETIHPRLPARSKRLFPASPWPREIPLIRDGLKPNAAGQISPVETMRRVETSPPISRPRDH